MDPEESADWAPGLLREAGRWWSRYLSDQETAALSEAIAVARQGIAAADGDDVIRALLMNCLGGYLYEYSLVTDDLTALREAAQLAAGVLAVIPPEHPERPMLLDNLRRLLFAQFVWTGETSALAGAVRAARDAVLVLLTGRSARPGRAAGLAAALSSVLDRLADDATIDDLAGLVDEPVVDLDIDEDDDADPGASAGHDGRHSLFLTGLALKVLTLADRANDLALLAEAMELSRDAVGAIPAGHPHRRLALNGLWLAAWSLGRQNGDAAVLAEGVEAAREALASMSADDPERTEAMDDLSLAVRVLADWTGDDDLLAEAAQLARSVVAITSAGHPERARYLETLRATLNLLFERTKDSAVLAEAVQVAREAVAITAPDEPDRAEYLAGLSIGLQELSDLTGDAAALAEAVRAAREAAQTARDDDIGRCEYLYRLGTALLTSYERWGSDQEFGEMVRVYRAALAAAPPDSVDRCKYLSGLGFALRVQFERSGDAAVLAEAVAVAGEAVATAPAGHPARAVYLTNFGTALQSQYAQTGELAVLARAVQAARDAVAATPVGHVSRANYLSNLANALRLLFQRGGDPEVLAEAVQAGRDAVAASSGADTGRDGHLGNFATSLYLWSRETGDTEALAEAVQAARDSAAAAIAGTANRARCLSNLGNLLRRAYELTADPAVLAEAAMIARDAVDATPLDQPDRTGHLANLGYVLVRQADEGGGPQPLARARDCFAEAARNTAAPAAQRILCYREAADLAVRAGGTAQQALSELEAAVALLPQVAARDLVRADQEHAVATLAAFAGQVAAAAVAAGRPDRAVELLEQTRGILVADTLDARSSDLTRLQDAAPALATEFRNLRRRFDTLNRSDGAVDSPDLASQRRDAYASWDALIARIRRVGGCEDFLRPPDIRLLARQAAAGPVIFPYASQLGCGALILTDDQDAPVLAVPADLTEETVYSQARRLARALAAEPDASGDHGAQQAVLGWLWDVIAGPVLDTLGYTATPADGRVWPRVWWCPIGIFAGLPWHAAGHHDGSGRAVMDRVVSSYATTLRGLAYSRALKPDAAAGATLIVVASDAPGASVLPGAKREAQMLERFIPGATVLRHPTRDVVLAALPSSHAVHFACHGYADGVDPAASQLILYDHRTHPLSVARISALRLVSGLAYLSACDTAVTSEDLTDEAVHICGAFHLAGYQNVIGTLWRVGDGSAGMVAEDFYRRLTSGGTKPPDTSISCYALHAATRRLRSRFPDQPTHWAGYIHTGG